MATDPFNPFFKVTIDPATINKAVCITTIKMVKNFEDETCPLTYEELGLLPMLINGFKNRSASNPITGKEICQKMGERYGIKFPESRLRKMVNYIRVNSLAPIIATSKGYFSTEDPAIISDQILSLEARAQGIQLAADGLKKFI